MQQTVRLLRIGVAAMIATFPLSAQSTRDSAGVRIVENAKPAWTDAERLVLAATPRLVMGNDADSAYRFRQVRGVMLFADGRIAVADGGSMQLRIFNAEGRLVSVSKVKGDSPGPQPQQWMGFVRRLRGDTIAICSSFSSMALYSSNGQFARTTQLPSKRDAGPAGRFLLLEVLGDGVRVAAPLPPQVMPRATGERWAESITLQLFTTADTLFRKLGAFAYAEFEQVRSGPMPRWLSSIGVFAGADHLFYAGYGDRYEIREFASDGTLQKIIRRSWTPTPIASADWETWVVEWSKLWIKSTGAERERDVQEMRDAPWAEVLPAFSAFLVDRSGRLWVRDAHWQDAIAAGQLTDPPAVPSTWSVFDTQGQWLGDVSMPADFQPYEIGTDYVAGRAWTKGVGQVAIYALRSVGR